MRMNKVDRDKIINTIAKRYVDQKTVTSQQVADISTEFGFDYLPYSVLKDARASRGNFYVAKLMKLAGVTAPAKVVDFPTPKEPVVVPATTENYTQKIMDSSAGNLVPVKDSVYVKTGHHADITKVIKSEQFFPIFITGPSGNGKSMTVVQACAGLNRELVRINVTAGTDEDDLIGSFRLVDGDTVWQDGPIVEAMVRGAVVLIDEIDMLNPNRAASLFTALEGKGVFIKKIGRLVEPKKGFNIIATAIPKVKVLTMDVTWERMFLTKRSLNDFQLLLSSIIRPRLMRKRFLPMFLQHLTIKLKVI